MATALPAALKTADLHRFAARAAQLQNFRPVITYWCEYYVLQGVLSKQLHANDPQCSEYAISLMDKLEAFKQSHATDDTVTDDVAAKAYVENFALETFARGDDAQMTNKVTRQTADTFQAAATFIDLLSIWGTVDEELRAKSKYAKFHALRIAKAIKAGEDPNDSNPVVETPQVPQIDDDNVDAELKELETQAAADTPAYRPPTVESAPDSRIPSRPTSVVPDEPFEAPQDTADAQPSEAPREDEHKLSPDEPSESENVRHASLGGGYFPAVPGTAEPAADNMFIDPRATAPPPELQTPFTPSAFYNNASDPSPTQTPNVAPPPPAQSLPRPFSIQTRNANFGPGGPLTPAAAIVQTPGTVPPPPQYNRQATGGSYNTDDEAVLAAQKHAKWAISALNFEDVPTAVKELRIALRALGAS
ncbi:Vacuolar protein sorting-associated protein vts1 [Acrodontium crateriforme]|uniref:Vacuolar protein sorting-associated protein vts1 n=1 Tax=Acrodontium crateriforme TaxID=150365 RepID=A0AAQ3M5N7_9PEZI|nr:Vacuolar protein sorting-associated protein vts1 [Acrodontium crateriforme]